MPKSAKQLDRDIAESLAETPAQLDRDIAEVLAAHAGTKRGGSLRSGHAPTVPELTRKTQWAPRHPRHLTDEQLAVLRTFANKNGRAWKSALNTAWSTGRYHDYNGAEEYGVLQEIRNIFGPSWLHKFSFNNIKTHSRA